MRVRLFSSLLVLLGVISFFGGGCASPHASQLPFPTGEYKKLLERQKAGIPVEQEALKNLPEMTAAEYETLGDNYLRQGNTHMAFVHYDRALRLDPTQVRMRYKIGLLFLKKGVAEEAIKEFQEILTKDARYALAYEGMGQALFTMQNVAEAEKNFRQALQLNTDLWQSHNFLGIMYARQKRFDEAIAAYQAAIAITPEAGLLLNNLGMAYYAKGEYEHAVQAFREALKTEPSENKISNNLGLAMGKLGRYQEAFEAFQQGDDEAKAYNNLGVIYLGEGRYQEAISAFEKALELNPSYYTRASENLKLAKAALAEVVPVSLTKSDVNAPPLQAVPAVRMVNPDPGPWPADLGSSSPDPPPPKTAPATGLQSTATGHRPQPKASRQLPSGDVSADDPQHRPQPKAPRQGHEAATLENAAERDNPPYTVQVHAFRSQEKAEELVDQYLEQGFGTFSAAAGRTEEGRWWQVYIGRFDIRAEAEVFGRELRQRGVLTEFIVVRMPRMPGAGS